MIIDCHGHYTTAPKALEDWRNRQVDGLKNPALTPKVSELRISDDELKETIEKNQLKLMRERGISCLPVVEGDKLVGVITERYLIDVSAKLLESYLRDAQQ